MLFRQNACGKRVCVVGFEYRDGSLKHNHTVVQVLVDKMNRAAGYFDAVVEGLLLRLKAGEGRQKRWVDVEDSIGKGGYEVGGQKAHVAGEADEIDAVGAEAGDHIGVVLGAGAAFGNKHCVRQTQLLGGGDSGSVGHVGVDDGDFNAGETAFTDGLRDSEEVGAAT